MGSRARRDTRTERSSGGVGGIDKSRSYRKRLDDRDHGRRRRSTCIPRLYLQDTGRVQGQGRGRYWDYGRYQRVREYRAPNYGFDQSRPGRDSSSSWRYHASNTVSTVRLLESGPYGLTCPPNVFPACGAWDKRLSFR